jgi:hypothetical protein
VLFIGLTKEELVMKFLAICKKTVLFTCLFFYSAIGTSKTLEEFYSLSCEEIYKIHLDTTTDSVDFGKFAVYNPFLLWALPVTAPIQISNVVTQKSLEKILAVLKEAKEPGYGAIFNKLFETLRKKKTFSLNQEELANLLLETDKNQRLCRLTGFSIPYHNLKKLLLNNELATVNDSVLVQ